MAGLRILHRHWSALTTELREQRERIDGLAVKFNKEHGAHAETTQRAGELSIAIQRLERALLQQQLQILSTRSAVVGGLQ
jgi:hypothetical protein